MKKGYWVVAYKSISDESATKGIRGISGACTSAVWRTVYDEIVE
jgi:hypothetical protein